MARVLRTWKLFSSFTNIPKSTPICRFNTHIYALNNLAHTKVVSNGESATLTDVILDTESKFQKYRSINDNDLRMVVEIFCKGDQTPTSAQLLSMIGFCGYSASPVPPVTRTDLLKDILKKSSELNLTFDISHYNAVLRVYLENEQKFSPSKFLDDILLKNVTPNRVTYQLLLANYCHQGNLEGATEMLENMKRNEYPINEFVFNSLITGYGQINDMASAEGIIQIMQDKDLEVSSSTYTALLSGYANTGNINKIKETLIKCKESNVMLDDLQILHIIYVLSSNGFYEHARELIGYLQRGNRYERDAQLAVYRFLHKNDYKMSLEILSTMPYDPYGNNLRFFMRYIGYFGDLSSLNIITEYFKNKGYKPDPVYIILYYALANKRYKKSLDIIKTIHSRGDRIKSIYFLPILSTYATERQFDKLVDIVKTMKDEYSAAPNRTFLQQFVFDKLTRISDVKVVAKSLKTIKGVRNETEESTLMHLLSKYNCGELEKYFQTQFIPMNTTNYQIFVPALSSLFLKTNNPQSFVKCLYYWALQRKTIEEIKMKNLQMNEEEDDSFSQRPSDAIKKLVGSLLIHLSRGKIAGKKISNLMEELVAHNLGIEQEVAENLKDNWSEEVDVLNLLEQMVALDFKNTETTDTLSADLVEFLNSNIVQNEKQKFIRSVRTNNFMEAESLLKEHSELQNPKSYAFLIRKLMEGNDEQKLIQYLKHFVEITEDCPIDFHLCKFICLELLKRGYLKEGFQLLRNCNFTALNPPALLGQIVDALVSSNNEVDLNAIFDLKDVRGVRIFNLHSIVSYYCNKYSTAKAVEVLDIIDIPENYAPILCNALLYRIFNENNIELFRTVINYLEKLNIERTKTDLYFAYSCMGDIKKGRELLRNENSRLAIPIKAFSNLLPSNRCTVLENAIKILKDEHGVNKLPLYELLMNCYVEDGNAGTKGLELWTDMQEENVIPSESILEQIGPYIQKKRGVDEELQVTN